MEYEGIGTVLRELRRLHGLTQEELAFGICAVSTLSKIENGHCRPRDATVFRLMKKMGEPCSSYRIKVKNSENQVITVTIEQEQRE